MCCKKLIGLISGSLLMCYATLVQANEVINAQQVAESCLSPSWNNNALIQLKQDNFVVTDTQIKQQLLMQLMNCLASPDPELRDELAYTGISQWLRENSFTPDVYLTLFNRLVSVLTQTVDDAYGVYQPFAALMFAEVVRVDRKTPYLTAQQRQQAVDVITEYFSQIDDYRGFDTQVGWRHNVAHSADVMLQLALNPAVNQAQLEQMLAALKPQVVAKNNHFYVYGEPKRMAMPLVYLFLRDGLSIEQWQAWLSEVTAPAPFASWREVYQNQQGLAKLHNTRQLLAELYLLIADSDNERLQAMMPALNLAIKALG